MIVGDPRVTPSSVKKKILVVDDEPRFTRVLKLTLEDTGLYEVQVENGGAHVLSAVQSFQPDLILLDLLMPDRDGATVAAQLKADPALRKIPVIFLTAMLSKEDALLRSGILKEFPLLTKPVDLDDLLDQIHRSLQPPKGSS